jgi:serine/threonine protein kinase
MPETLREGRFVVLGTLGEGSQGRTFDGVDKREGTAVAIKQFDVRGAKTWKDVELAEREARVLKSLTHPKLPKYVDHFEEDGSLYLVMEKIEGESLAAMRARGATLSDDEIFRFLRDAADVLDYLHGRAPPVFHRDLKPGNVLRRPDGSFAFVDFGAVREKLRVTGGSTIVGTFGYMAPEQFQGRALPATDVYAVGATAISMLTGQEPEDLPHRGLGIDVRAALGNHASNQLVTILEKMVEPDPDRRAARVSQILPRRSSRVEAARKTPSVRAAPNVGDPHQVSMKEFFASAAQHSSRHERRRAERETRREEKRARRAERFEQRFHSHGPRWPISLLLSLGISLGIFFVVMATQVVVPLLLVFLSVLFARQALQNAAHRVRLAGRAAVANMTQSRRWLLGDTAPPVLDEARVSSAPLRVESPERPIRVEEEVAHDRDDDEDEIDPPHKRRTRDS